MFENRQLAVFEGKCRRFRNSSELTLPRIIDQLRRKRCQKKHKDVDYKLLLNFFQKYAHCIRMFCTGCFILNGIVIDFDFLCIRTLENVCIAKST